MLHIPRFLVCRFTLLLPKKSPGITPETFTNLSQSSSRLDDWVYNTYTHADPNPDERHDYIASEERFVDFYMLANSLD